MTSTRYRDVQVNLTNPRTERDRAAAVIMKLLQSGQQVLACDVDFALDNVGIHRSYKAHALKGLRNAGYVILASKARHLSWYQLAGTPEEINDMSERYVREWFSAAITLCRLMHSATTTAPSNLILGTAYNHALMTAMTLGTVLGHTHQQVLDMAQPL